MGPSTLFEKWDPKCLNCLLYKAPRLPNNLFFSFQAGGKIRTTIHKKIGSVVKEK